MKVLLILLVIVICVLGFFAFLWYASKQETHKPIDKVKEEDKNESEFIKKMQEQHKQSHKQEAKKIVLLNPENRGKLFEQAIKRKQNAYKQDDEEYELRLSKQEHSIKEEEQQEQQEEKTSKTIEQKEEDVTVTFYHQKSEETGIGGDWEEVNTSTTVLDAKGRINRNEDNATSFLKRKEQVEKKEQVQKMAIQSLREEILLEVENIKKRRLAFISAATTN